MIFLKCISGQATILIKVLRRHSLSLKSELLEWPTNGTLCKLWLPWPSRVPALLLRQHPWPRQPSRWLSSMPSSLSAQSLRPRGFPSVTYRLLELHSGLWSEAFLFTFKISSYLPFPLAAGTDILLRINLFGYLSTRNVSFLREGTWLFLAVGSRTLNSSWCIGSYQ